MDDVGTREGRNRNRSGKFNLDDLVNHRSDVYFPPTATIFYPCTETV